MKKNEILNSVTEVSLRIAILLESLGEKCLDINQITVLDYYILHINDFNISMNSLHPPIPHRENQLLIKREITQEAVFLLRSRGLIKKNYTKMGIKYSSNELTRAFVGYFETNYAIQLVENMKTIPINQIEEFINKILNDISNETNYWVNGLISKC